MTLRSIAHESDDVSRRMFLGTAASAFLGLGTMPLLARGNAGLFFDDDKVPLRPATARNVIYLYMAGGMSHLDTLDTKPGAETQGPTESIGTKVDGIQLASHFGNLARLTDRVAIVNSMSSTQGAHAQGRYFMHTSYELRGTIKHPSMGAWLTKLGGPINPTLPSHVAVSAGTHTASEGFFESKYTPVPIGDPAAGLQNCKCPDDITEKTFNRRLDRLRKMNESFASKYKAPKAKAYGEMYEQAVRLMKSKDLAAFDITKEPENLRNAYGDDSFGQGCLLARRLVEHGVRYVEVVSGGWDTHNDNFDDLAEKVPQIDRTLSSLLVDLESRGLLDETLVVLTTEFGRTPQIVTERNNGRNHYPKAFSSLLAGGGIKGGLKYGKTDATGSEIVENKVTVPDFNATIAYALGLPLEHVVMSPSGRPFTVADKGKPVMDLFA